MSSTWLDSWGTSWGDAWGEQAADPNRLRGTASGTSTCSATLTMATAEVIAITGGDPRRRPRTVNKPVNFQPELKRRREEAAALLLTGCI